MGLIRVLWTAAATWCNQPLFELHARVPTWWNQPLFEIPLEQLLHGFAPPMIPAAVTTITTAARGAWWLKGAPGVQCALAAAVTHLSRTLLRNRASTAAAHVLANQFPHAAPMPWRVAWFVLTSVLTLIGPPAVKALQKIHTSRQTDATATLLGAPPLTPQAECSVDGLTSVAWQLDAVQACLPSMIPCLLTLILGYVIGRARGWIKAPPVVPLQHDGFLDAKVKVSQQKVKVSQLSPDTDEHSVELAVIELPATEKAARTRSIEPLDSPRRLGFEAVFEDMFDTDSESSFPFVDVSLSLALLIRRSFLWWREAAHSTKTQRDLLRIACSWLCTVGVRSLSVRRAMNSWLCVAKGAANVRGLLVPVVRRLMNVGLARGWRTWLEMVTARRERVRLLTWSMRFILQRQLAMGFATWQGAWYQHGAWCQHMVATRAMETRRQMSTVRVLSILANQDQARGFKTWQVVVDGVKANHQLVLDACQAWMGNHCRRAWHKWRELVLERQLFKRAAHAFRTPLLCHASATWADSSRAGARVNALLAGAVRSFQTVKIRQAYIQWTAAASQLVLQTKVLRSLLAVSLHASAHHYTLSPQVMRSLLAVAFRSEQLSGLRVWHAHAALVRKRRVRVEQTARRAIKSMSLQSLRAAMNTWVAMSEARQRNQQKLLSAASAFRGDSMRKAWNGWLGLLHDRQVMASAVYCLTHRLQRAGFASWVFAMHGTLKKKKQLRAYMSTLSPAKRSMRKAINSWSEYGHTMWALSRAAAAMRLREERVAFSTWHEHACSDGEREAAMRRAVASMIQSSLRVSLNTWMSYAEEHAEASRVLAGALSSLKPEGRAMRRALNTWAGVMMQRRSMVVAVASLTNSEQLWGLRTWHAHAALVRKRRVRVEQTARRAIKSMSLQSLRAAMNTWVAMSEARQRNQQKLLSAASAFRGDGMRKAINTWSENVEVSRLHVIAGRCAWLCFLRRGLAIWVSLWRYEVRSARELRRKVLGHVPPAALKAVQAQLVGGLRRKVLSHVPPAALEAVQTEEPTVLVSSDEDNILPTGSRLPTPPPSP